MNRFVILSGCSGGGKSTLLSELQRRGFRTVAEPGRRIVAQEQATGGTALPWTDLAAFTRRALALSIADRKGLPPDGDWTFFDRGIIDAAAALQHATGDDSALDICRQYPSHSTVFLTPPWPQIYAADEERRHDLADALLEYDRLVDLYPRLGYRLAFLPKASVAERADWLLAQLGSLSSAGRL